MLIDVHAHFHPDRSPRNDWREYNASRLARGERMGITRHVASILGTFGRTSPTFSPPPPDVTYGNAAVLALQKAHPTRIRGYVCVNPNYTDHAVAEITRCVKAGMIGLKLAASRRADDALLDPVCRAAARHRLPVLHHIWQHRRHDWPQQEASDAVELCALALRHPTVSFILAHIGGGGDWLHSPSAARDVPNVFLDLSGSGVDGGMLEACVESVGVNRLLWGADMTLCTGWAKLRYLEKLLPLEDVDQVRWRNAAALFPAGAFPGD